MVGFPKVIKTKADLVNTFKLVKKGRLKAADWLAAVEKLENQNYIFCPIMFVNEVAEGDKVKAGNLTATVNSVEHIDVDTAAAQEETEAEAGADTGTETAVNNNQTRHTVLTLSRAIAADAETIGVPAAVTFYERLGITEEEVEAMKGELA